jgi:hypothetical protein
MIMGRGKHKISERDLASVMYGGYRFYSLSPGLDPDHP